MDSLINLFNVNVAIYMWSNKFLSLSYHKFVNLLNDNKLRCDYGIA